MFSGPCVSWLPDGFGEWGVLMETGGWDTERLEGERKEEIRVFVLPSSLPQEATEAATGSPVWS